MNEQEYEEKYGVRPVMNRFDSTEQISKHLLDVNDYESTGVNHDSARANLAPSELRQARADGYLIQELEEAEKVCHWDLSVQKAKTFGRLGVLNVTSRSKNGWMAMLSKTNKEVHIQQLEDDKVNLDSQYNPEVEQGLGNKVMGKIPFLKKKTL